MTSGKKLSPATKVIQLSNMPNGGASDLLLKEDVVEVTDALKRILALRPVTWYWKHEPSNKVRQHGFIAQEVEEIFPELVTIQNWDDDTSRKFLSTKELLPYLVKAIEEQQQQIKSLRQKIKALEKSKDASY